MKKNAIGNVAFIAFLGNNVIKIFLSIKQKYRLFERGGGK